MSLGVNARLSLAKWQEEREKIPQLLWKNYSTSPTMEPIGDECKTQCSGDMFRTVEVEGELIESEGWLFSKGWFCGVGEMDAARSLQSSSGRVPKVFR